MVSDSEINALLWYMHLSKEMQIDLAYKYIANKFSKRKEKYVKKEEIEQMWISELNIKL